MKAKSINLSQAWLYELCDQQAPEQQWKESDVVGKL